MVQCAIRGCKSRSDIITKLDNSNIHFHRIPKSPDIREKWMQAMSIYCDKISNCTRICSNHFRKECYYKTTHGLNYLYFNAVPEINMNLEVVEKNTDYSDDEEMPQSKLTKQPVSKLQQGPAKDLGVSADRVPQNSNPNQSEQRTASTTQNTQELMTIVNLSESTVKTEKDPLAVKEYTKVKIKTPIERKLLKEIRRLQELSKKRLEAINCLEEQNRRLLTRNTFLQETLDKYEKVSEEVNNAVVEDLDYF